MNKEILQQALRALVIAEAGLADIGDADREPGDDLAWCEARAAQALELPRAAIIALRASIAQPVSNIAFLYEELRKATDGGSESMTHDDALAQIKYCSDMAAIAQPVQPAAWHPTETAITALKRFEETCTDNEGYDVPQDTMRNLAAIGLIYRTYGDMYHITDFGQHILATAIAQPKDKQ